MKRIGRMLALLVSMLLLVGLTACTPRSVVGSWRCTVDLSRAAQAAGALDGMDEQSGVGVVLAKLLDGQTLELALELRKDVPTPSARIRSPPALQRIPSPLGWAS